MIGIFIALISGALMSIQGVFNTHVTEKSSIWVANSWVQFTALLCCAVAWFFTGRESFSGLWQMNQKYTLLGGVLGAFITYTVIRSMNDLGPAKSVMLIVIAQLAVAYGIEIFGIFGVEKQAFEWRKLFGLLISIAGIIVFKWK